MIWFSIPPFMFFQISLVLVGIFRGDIHILIYLHYFKKNPTEEGHCRERNMSQKSFISLEYQDLLKKKTSKLLQTLQMHDLTLNGW